MKIKLSKSKWESMGKNKDGQTRLINISCENRTGQHKISQSWYTEEVAVTTKDPNVLTKILKRNNNDVVSGYAAEYPNCPPLARIRWMQNTGKIAKEDPKKHYIEYEEEKPDKDLEALKKLISKNINKKTGQKMKINIGSQSKIWLWLDDERDPSDSFIQKNFGVKGNEIWVTTIEEAQMYINNGNATGISFDNDLGEDKKEGYELAKWIEEMAYFRKIPRLQWRVHSQNNVGSVRIKQAMENADMFWSETENELV